MRLPISAACLGASWTKNHTVFSEITLQANRRIEKFVINCYEKKIEKLNIITGKGLRSRVEQNPYQSKDFSILKYSVPEFIKSNSELMRFIKKIEDNGDNKNSGCFTLFLKIKE